MVTGTNSEAEFGGELRRLRIAAGRRQREVAEVLGGVSVPYVHDIERGNRNPPTLERIPELAALFGVPEDAERLAMLAVEQKGEIRMNPSTPEQTRLLVALDRKIREGSLSKTRVNQLLKMIG